MKISHRHGALRLQLDALERSVLPTEILETLRVLRDRGTPIVGKLRRSFLSRPVSPDDADRHRGVLRQPTTQLALIRHHGPARRPIDHG